MQLTSQQSKLSQNGPGLALGVGSNGAAITGMWSSSTEFLQGKGPMVVGQKELVAVVDYLQLQ